jgi:hypothetical protein
VETETLQSALFARLEALDALLPGLLSFRGLAVGFLLLFGIGAGLFFFQSFYKTSLLLRSASQGNRRMTAASAVSAVFEALEKLFTSLTVLLPLLAGLILSLTALAGLIKLTNGVHQFVEREKRIRELSIAIKYLAQSEKVFDVRILSVANGTTALRLQYQAVDEDSAVPRAAWQKDIAIPGQDIYFDCMVLNFSYSEIALGRQKNIAIPYRVFSNRVAANQGVYLHKELAEIPEEDDYGFIPPAYRESLARLLTDEGFARDMGLRSVNGSALHRYAVPGDRYKVRINQSGGVSFE